MDSVSRLLAQQGFTGAREFLLGRWGYFRAFEPNPNLEALTENLVGQPRETRVRPLSDESPLTFQQACSNLENLDDVRILLDAVA